MEKAINFFKRSSLDKCSLFFSKSISKRQKSSTFQDDSFRQVKKRLLFENFAEDLLNLELDMEQPIVDVKAINKLLELYANGVEYYESIRSNRYVVFQEKMKNLLMKPNVIEALTKYNNKEEETVSVTLKEEQKISQIKLKELEKNLYIIKQKSNEEDIKYLVEEKKNTIEEINKFIFIF